MEVMRVGFPNALALGADLLPAKPSGEAPRLGAYGTPLGERSESLKRGGSKAESRGTPLGERSESLSGEAHRAYAR